MSNDLPPVDQQLENETGNTSDDFGWLDGESEQEYVARINKGTGRKFKNVGDIVKNIQSADKKIIELSRQPKEAPQAQTSPDDLEVLFYGSNSKAGLVKEDLKTIAAAKYGGSVLKAWSGESWIQAKADALEKEEKRKAIDAKKVLTPSGQPSGAKGFSIKNVEHVIVVLYRH